MASHFIANCINCIVYTHVKVQREALAESSVVFGRVFGNKMGRRLTVVEEGLFSGIATSTVQVSYKRYTFTCSQQVTSNIGKHRAIYTG